MKNPIRISKRAYSEILKIQEMIDVLRAQSDTISRLEQKVDNLELRINDLRSEYQINLQYQNKIQTLYFDSLYRIVSKSDDISKFFMEIPKATGSMRLYQLGCKKLLDEIVSLCDKNGFTYWLQSGSMLGAIRHRGFVPWDDDLDIAMLRADIISLRKILEKNKQYQITLLYDYYNCSRQLRFRTRDKNNPCFIDVYIYDFGGDVSDDTWKKWHTEKEAIRDKIYREIPKDILEEWEREAAIDERTERGKIIGKVFNKYYPTKGKVKSKKEPNIHWQLDNFPVKWNRLFDYDFIFPLKKVEFEGSKYYAPNEYIKHLQRQYGDIYTLPKDIVTHFHHIDQDNINTEAIQKFLEK